MCLFLLRTAMRRDKPTKKFANKMDIKHTEVLHISRYQLERILQNRGLRAYNQFFESVINTTQASVYLPDRETIADMESKPSFRLTGKLDQVRRARKLILAFFRPRAASRITLEMDVSNKYYSFIIGHDGENLKRIIDATNVYIHFTRNLNTAGVRQNQVEITGATNQVERARSLIRSNSPLMYIFDFPHPIENFKSHQYIKMLELMHHVRIVFTSKPMLLGNQVSIRGSEMLSAQVRYATQLVMNFIWSTDASQMYVRCEMDISEHYHEFIKGYQNMKLFNIMHATETTIIFPDAQRPEDRTKVVVIGCIDNVNRARQQLMGNIPVILKFNYYQDDPQLDMRFDELSQKYGVQISKFTNADHEVVIWIKAAEKFMDNIYATRCEILGIPKHTMRASIPYNYYESQDLYLANLTDGYPIVDGNFRYRMEYIPPPPFCGVPPSTNNIPEQPPMPNFYHDSNCAPLMPVEWPVNVPRPVPVPLPAPLSSFSSYSFHAEGEYSTGFSCSHCSAFPPW